MFEHKPRPEWVATEEFLSDTVVHPDGAVQQASRAAAEAGMPPIEVAPNAGKLLKLLAQLAGARRILEIGTLAGYSTIWMARALAGINSKIGATPKLITLEYDPKHAAIARKNFTRAGIDHLVELREGPALAS